VGVHVLPTNEQSMYGQRVVFRVTKGNNIDALKRLIRMVIPLQLSCAFKTRGRLYWLRRKFERQVVERTRVLRLVTFLASIECERPNVRR